MQAYVSDTHSLPATCIRRRSTRIDVGVASPVNVGKEILAASSEYGSPLVAVVAQEKRWNFSGHGVARGDQLKWVNASATHDEHCDWLTDFIDVDALINGTSTAADIIFSANSEDTGPLQLCYRFSSGDNPFKLYPGITLSVYELYEILAAAEGSTSISVVGYSKVLTMSGFGVSEFDEVRWVLGPSTNCTTAADVASLSYGGVTGENSAILSSSHEASFDFSTDVFVTNVSTKDTSANATLCYKFGSESFQHYSNISMQIRHIAGWTSSVGASSVAVVGVTESIEFSGYGISAGMITADRARWIISGTDCYDNTADLSDVMGGLVNVSNGQAAFTFSESVSGQSPRLCYWFENEPALVYPTLTIDVAHLSSISAPSFGDPDVAVVGYAKPWGFAGGHIDDGDTVRWIYNDSSDCSDNSESIAEISEDGEVVAGESACTFTTASSGRWIAPCYR